MAVRAGRAQLELAQSRWQFRADSVDHRKQRDYKPNYPRMCWDRRGSTNFRDWSEAQICQHIPDPMS